MSDAYSPPVVWPGEKTKYGECVAVGTNQGERFYMFTDEHGGIRLMPGDMVDREGRGAIITRLTELERRQEGK